MKENLGIYIHIPFCVQKCRYCDFTSYAQMSEELKNRYIKSLLNQIQQMATGCCAASLPSFGGRTVDSIFFGGGTPSLLSPAQLGEIMTELRSHFVLTDDCEITMEANPGTVSLETLQGYRNLGFNRISFGVQSMEPEILKILGRIHGPEEAAESVRLAREAGFENLNLDLMFGIPGQTLEQWKSTLTKITDLKPEHISFYSLQVEEGTPIYNEIKFGRLEPLTDEEDREMYHAGLEYLRDQGYHQYEISNGAKPGKECRHNIKYWTLSDYVGFGVSAHGFVDGVRYSQGDDILEYVEALERGESPVVWIHKNEWEDSASEFMFTGLRLAQGVDLDEFEERFGMSVETMYSEILTELEEFQRQGFVVVEEGGAEGAGCHGRKGHRRMYLTESGMDISNRIMALFV
ncbi:MAG: radical SAM family heme chaperone HemW [Firmicutes bacterium]|nr:radical SAM family heme chaperone HemW [Bacillota bacterium]